MFSPIGHGDRMAYQTAGDATFAIMPSWSTVHRDQWAQWYKAGASSTVNGLQSQWLGIEFQSVAKVSLEMSQSNGTQFYPACRKELAPELHETVYTVDYKTFGL